MIRYVRHLENNIEICLLGIPFFGKPRKKVLVLPKEPGVSNRQRGGYLLNFWIYIATNGCDSKGSTMNKAKSARSRSHAIKKDKRSHPGQNDPGSLFRSFSRRMIADFEVETEDFAFLCLIASAHGLDQWPEGAVDSEDDVRFLTFH